jgi:hypothetical protein
LEALLDSSTAIDLVWKKVLTLEEQMVVLKGAVKG